MKRTDSFASCGAISYDAPIDAPDFLITDIYGDPEQLLFLSNIGYSAVMRAGKLTLEGDETTRARLIADEISYLIDVSDYYELRDYVVFHCWSDDVLVDEVKLAIRETILQKPYDVRFIDVLEYIVDSWVISEKQKKELNRRQAEDFRELSERVYH